ncbi:helix-turn-helix transcriptional regulator [Natronolimnohabitans innermongolicus]|uniref:Transcriptional regulator n=2 Tax=Natronolimnohabitans innermongolicus TaxID=253107 RepID=L9WPE6_9EURY|nr:MarR family transcriptional regulator [Natronolimnohabitans innermongolicus]ELY50218.1 transcriptional regulator [Natronolimnohabitans innermongolicus JCM 12255]
MEHRRRDSPIGDIAYLTRSEHRVPTLVALTERPQSRSGLCELTGVSSSTIRRTLTEFEDRNWIRKEGYQFVATTLGESIASGMEDLLERVEVERKLRDVWHLLPNHVIEFTIEMSSETTVTVADHDAPYRPIGRFRSLLQDADQFRFLGVDIALLEPCREEFRQRLRDGMQAEIIDPPNAARYVLSTYPELCSDILESGNLNPLVHDDVPPYGLSFFDDRVAVNDYDPDTAGVEVLIDTDTPAAQEWAESVYTTYKTESRPLEYQQIVG